MLHCAMQPKETTPRSSEENPTQHNAKKTKKTVMTQVDVGMANAGSMWDAASHESSSSDEESLESVDRETWNRLIEQGIARSERMLTFQEARQITRASRATMEVIRASREEAMVSLGHLGCTRGQHRCTRGHFGFTRGHCSSKDDTTVNGGK